jgi:hypothetical protein
MHTLFLPPPHHVLELDIHQWSQHQGFTSSKSM